MVTIGIDGELVTGFPALPDVEIPEIVLFFLARTAVAAPA
jgi:hypothetical protein